MISVIIPTFNEATHLPATLQALAENSGPCEVIVVDAGSSDGTVECAAMRGVRVIEGLPPDRSAQMNRGARAAGGDGLLFLHADTRVPASAIGRIDAALEDAAVVGGGFARRYDSPSGFLQLTCLLAEARARASGWFLGDQAIFVRRRTFEQLNGFRDLPIFADLDFSRRMRCAGKVVTLRPPIVSSARRFAEHGPLRTTFRDFKLTLLYMLGHDPKELATRTPRRECDRCAAGGQHL